MRPEAVIRLARANPGTPVRLAIVGRPGRGEVRVKWEDGGLKFWLRPLRLWDGPKAEPEALRVMEPWRILEAWLEGEDGGAV